MRESYLVAKILKALNALPHTRAYKVHATLYSRAGEPDLLGCSWGWFFAIEVKRPGGRPLTPLQRQRLSEWSEAGAVTGLAHSVKEALTIVSACRAGVRLEATPSPR